MTASAPDPTDPAPDDGRQRARYLERILDSARSATLVVAIDGTVRYASAGAARYLGSDISGESIFQKLHPDDVERAVVSLAVSDEVRDLRYFPMVFRVLRPDGTDAELDVLVTNALDDPLLRGLVLSVHAADERTQYLDPIRALANGTPHEEVIELIAAGVGRGGTLLRPAFVASRRDPDSGAFQQVTAVRATDELRRGVERLVAEPDGDVLADLAPRELRAAGVDDLPDPAARCLRAAGFVGLRAGAVAVFGRVEALLLAAEPATVWQEGRWVPATVDHWRQLLDLAAVAFEHDRVQTELVHAATHDPLTGLANRSAFFERLQRMMARGEVTVLYLDLDGFKEVNDRSGHAAGDEVLVEVARRITRTVRPTDLAGRLGGDEFAVAVSDVSTETAVALGERLVAAVSGPMPAAEGVHRVGLSVGLARQATDHQPDDLVRAADRALLDAKRSGGGTVVVAR